MANIAIISKTPDSHLPESFPTTIISVQSCSIFGGNINTQDELQQRQVIIRDACLLQALAVIDLL